jgi:lipoprotein-anchoring transpeptidase ErfK/SrfK
MKDITLADLHDKKSDPKSPKKKSKILPILFGIFIFLLAFIGSAYAYFKYYENKIYPGVEIANYDAGGLGKKEALALVDKKIGKLTTVGMVMQLDGETSTYEFTYNDLGITFDKEKTVENTLNVGRSGASYFKNALTIAKLLFEGGDVPLTLNLDEGKFKSKISAIIGNKLINPEDARFEIKDNQLVIVEEKNGTSLDFDYLKSQISDLITADNISKKVIIKTKTIAPSILKSDLSTIEAELNIYLNKKITYQEGYNYYTPGKDEIFKWINVQKSDGKMSAALNDDAIRGYIGYLASQVDVAEADKKVDASSGSVIFEGNDGRSMNQNKAFIETKNALNSKSSDFLVVLEVAIIPKKEVKIASYNGSGTPGLAGGKYVEVNLSTQTLFAFDGNNQIGAYTVSTGAWDYPTPVGTRSIVDKSLRPFSAQYGLYMPWWNGLGGGYGIHELPEWPGGYKEGESHLGTPVSHGCIRLGVGPAEFIYNWAPIGTPVFIHY